MEKLWEVLGNKPAAADNPEFILKEYADKVKVDTNGDFFGVVTDSVSEDTGSVSYALYILVPALKDYMYRLFEVNVADLTDPYPLELTHFAKSSKNHKTFTCTNPKNFRKKLEDCIKNPITKGILQHLKTLIEIKQAYPI